MAVTAGESAVSRAMGRPAAPLQATVTVDVWPHPVTAEGRWPGTAPAGVTLARMVADALPGQLCRAAVDGREVLPADWKSTRPAAGSIVTIRAAVAGDLDDIFRAVLALAVIAGAAYFGPAVGGALGLSGTAATAVGSAIITVGGTLVVNALVPPPTLPGPGDGGRADPVFSLVAGSNRTRLYEPQLLILGRHRVFPDFGAREYAQIVGDDQWLHAVFHCGVGDLDLEDIRIGETPIGDFDDVYTERAGPGGSITLVAGNVDTIAGATLVDDQWVTRRTADDTINIEVEFTASLFTIENDGSSGELSADVRIEYRRVGDAAWSNPIDITLTHDKQSIMRHVHRVVGLPTGEYDVRVRRLEDPSEEARERDEVAWSALRAEQHDTASYEGQTRLAMRIRASAQLQGRLDRVSLMAYQRIPVWNGAAWVTGRTSNPAWIFRWFALGIRAPDGRLLAGLGLAADRIDDATIKAWGAWCDAQVLSCDFPLDRAERRGDTLASIARCGRAALTFATGKLGAIWDAAGTPVTAQITPANVIAGSMEVDYSAGEPAEEVAVRYVEPDMDWQLNTVRRLMPGVVAPPNSTATITLRGVTSRRQAAEECNLQAARQLYHVRRLRWQMGPEVRNLARGTVVRLTHSLVTGGETGRVRAGTESRLDLGRDVAIGAADSLLVTLPDGTLHVSAVSRPAGAAAPGPEVQLTTPLPEAPIAATAHDFHWRLYETASPPLKVKIVAIKPLDDRVATVEAIDEVDAYYTAAGNDLTVDLRALQSRVPTVIGHRIAIVRRPVGDVTLLELELTPIVRGDWQGAVVRAGPDGEPVVPVALLQGGDTVARWTVDRDAMLVITVTPGTEGTPTGPVYRITHNINEVVAPGVPTDASVTELADGTRRFAWTPPADRDLAGILIRRAAGSDQSVAWDDMVPLHQGALQASPWESHGVAAGDSVLAFRAMDHAGALSDDTVRLAVTLGPQRGAGQRLFVYGNATEPTATDGVVDDRAVTQDGRLWIKEASGWEATDIDLTGPSGATIQSGNIAAGATPSATAEVAGSVFLATDGRWWKWVIDADGNGSWSLQGDLTGPKGDKGDQGAAATLPSGLYDSLNLTLTDTYTRNVYTATSSLVGTTFSRDRIHSLADGDTQSDGTRTLNASYDRTTYTYQALPSGGSPSPGPSRDAHCAA